MTSTARAKALEVEPIAVRVWVEKRMVFVELTDACGRPAQQLMADKLWVVNASPLVVLAKIGQLERVDDGAPARLPKEESEDTKG